MKRSIGGHAAGQALWKEVLKEFWVPFEQLISQTSGVRITEVIDVLDALIGQHFLPPQVRTSHSTHLKLTSLTHGTACACRNPGNCT